eukprot:31440-Pelagococcus_subviridis.AAC.12
MYFTIPVRAIKSLGDVRSFARTKTLASFVSFTKVRASDLQCNFSTLTESFHCLKELNASVRGLKLSEEIFISPLLQRLLKALSCLENTVRRCPPTGDLMRYGNVMYRDWHEQMVSSAGGAEWLFQTLKFSVPTIFFLDLLGDILPKQNHIGVVGVADHEAIVTRVFSKYVSVTRRLQTLYRLEPAGSHGVWGLDDYYFLSFYWGASQLVHQDVIMPCSVHDDGLLKSKKHEYLYFSCISYIKKVKCGLLRETSPTLNDISSVLSWEKINDGLCRMYLVG